MRWRRCPANGVSVLKRPVRAGHCAIHAHDRSRSDIDIEPVQIIQDSRHFRKPRDSAAFAENHQVIRINLPVQQFEEGIRAGCMPVLVQQPLYALFFRILVDNGDNLYLHPCPPGEPVHPHGAARREVVAEIGDIDLVHLGPLVHVCQHDRSLDDMVKR